PVPFSYHFTDTFISNGVAVHQKLKREVREPDFLFSATDPCTDCSAPMLYHRTDTSNWLNLAAQNGRPMQAGPGIIRPPVKITFERLGSIVYQYDSESLSTAHVVPQSMASFDSSSDSPIRYPTGPGKLEEGVKIYFQLWSELGGSTGHKWHLPVP